MKRWILHGQLVLALLTASSAGAAPYDGGAKILLHLAAPTTAGVCNAGDLQDCAQAATAGAVTTPHEGPFYFAYLAVARGNLPDLSGLICGITYDGGLANGRLNSSRLDVLGWYLCANTDDPAGSWPAPGGSNTIGWFTPACPTADVAVAGYFYVAAYAADTLRVTPRPGDGMSRVMRCDGTPASLGPKDLGWAVFSPGGSAAGCNPCTGPCDLVPVETRTWSGIKSGFRER